MGAHARAEERRAFWELIREGRTVEEASACLGRPLASCRRWFREAGGVKPARVDAPLPVGKSRRLSIRERERILEGIAAGESIRAIARAIERAPSTVSRELRVNLYHQRYGRPGTRGPKRSKPWRYSPHRAQLAADRRARRPKVAKLAVNEVLRAEVQTRLERKDSPEQIAARLKMDFPDQPEMWVSHETIYQSLYVQGRGALKRELVKQLRTGRGLRKPHRQSSQRRERFAGMVMISERPAEVEDRAVPGHWEGDLILGSTESGSAVGTLVERTTRFVMLLHLPGGHTADIVQEAMVTQMATLPEQLRRSLTWDQGVEMANHLNIAEATGLSIYFCDPHSPWQRGTNENTNGLLRQYLPKGTDLSFYGPGMLDNIAAELNGRPRKTLGWKTPAEALDELLRCAGQRGVATTG